MPYRDPLKYKKYQKEYRIKNHDKIVLLNTEYRKKNRERMKVLHHRYYMKHRVLSKRVLLSEDEKKVRSKNAFKRWYDTNRDRKIEQNRQWVNDNISKRRASLNLYTKNRRKIDNKFRIDQNTSNFIKLCIKKNRPGNLWEKRVGYSLGQLIKHLEKGFTDNMNWNNYGQYWSIDHIKPKNSFVYSSYEDDEFKKCWALSNLQPLTVAENVKKGSKFNEDL